MFSIASQIDDLKKIVFVLPRRRRQQFLAMLFLMLCGAIAEFVTLGAVVPFISIMGDPLTFFEKVSGTIAGGMLSDMNVSEARLALTAIFVALLVIAGTIRIVISWLSTRFAMAIGNDLSMTVYRNILDQSYSFHLNTPSADLLSSMQKINLFSTMVLIPLMQSTTALVTSVFIVAALLLVNTELTLLILVLTGSLYLVINFSLQPVLRRNSVDIAQGQSEKIRLVQEGVGGIRDIIINGLRDFYLNRFAIVEGRLRRRQTVNIFLTNVPRYFVETALLVVTTVVVYFVSRESGELSTILPTAAAFALGLQRILPNMQLIYRGRALISANSGSISDVRRFADMKSPRIDVAQRLQLRFDTELALQDVSFRYPGQTEDVLDSVNLRIAKGSFIGITGETGGGKSTLVDLIMGLQLPLSGRVLIDGVMLEEVNIASWRSRIAHVPQSIFLVDGTIGENIALGIDLGELDNARLEEVVMRAELGELIASLPGGLNARVGERGVRLSGGQRQRIGIARALYLNRDVLVLDEGTSALDSDTQRKVMGNLRDYMSGITVISITHRVDTLVNCDEIIRVEKGKCWLQRKKSGQRIS